MSGPTTAPGATAPAPDPAPPAQRHGRSGGGLVLAALGIVFGDIGTSPLYALQTVFFINEGAVRPTGGDVYGVMSMMFWSVTLIVSIKYIGVLMRADNDGEGGVMALTALARRLYNRSCRSSPLVIIGVLGVSLFYGDPLITPAISVLSAVEGVGLGHLVVPVAAVILTALFAVQRFGTGKVGALFGPVTLFWFAALAAAGVRPPPPTSQSPALPRPAVHRPPDPHRRPAGSPPLPTQARRRLPDHPPALPTEQR